MKADQFIKDLDKASAELLGGDRRRSHLGPSATGQRCPRAVWYGFRWAYHVQHGGRMYRLFERGNEEEARIVRWLRAAGINVEPFDLDGHQWGFTDGVHIAGSGDGKVSGLDYWFPNAQGRGLLECKTHSDKSFKQLQTKGVLSSKASHYNQMQLYMHYLDLTWGLYVAVNKNNDEIYVEVIHYKPEIAERYVERAHDIVAAQKAPPRITEDPGWFECRYCDFREICHYGKAPQKNCRSCAYASAETNGWRCNLFNGDIPDHFIPKGCDSWEPIE